MESITNFLYNTWEQLKLDSIEFIVNNSTIYKYPTGIMCNVDKFIIDGKKIGNKLIIGGSISKVPQEYYDRLSNLVQADQLLISSLLIISNIPHAVFYGNMHIYGIISNLVDHEYYYQSYRIVVYKNFYDQYLGTSNNKLSIMKDNLFELINCAEILADTKISDNQLKNIQLILKHSYNIVESINDFMDFCKVKTELVKKVTSTNVKSLLKGIYDTFNNVIISDDIVYDYIIEPGIVKDSIYNTISFVINTLKCGNIYLFASIINNQLVLKFKVVGLLNISNINDLYNIKSNNFSLYILVIMLDSVNSKLSIENHKEYTVLSYQIPIIQDEYIKELIHKLPRLKLSKVSIICKNNVDNDKPSCVEEWLKNWDIKYHISYGKQVANEIDISVDSVSFTYKINNITAMDEYKFIAKILSIIEDINTKIVICDNNVMHRNMLIHKINNLGFRNIIQMSNIKDCVKYINNNYLDILFIDEQIGNYNINKIMDKLSIPLDKKKYKVEIIITSVNIDKVKSMFPKNIIIRKPFINEEIRDVMRKYLFGSISREGSAL